MTHTPGPWKLADPEDEPFVYALNEAGTNRFFLSVQPGWITEGRHNKADDKRTPREELRANARLIAAAPSMYDALNQAPVLRLDESHSQFFERYSAWYRFDRRAAIAKAEERS